MRIRYIILILFSLALRFNGMRAQTDYSGVYYIGSGAIVNGSVAYDATSPTTNFYLCPTAGWCYYKPTNDFSGDGTTYPNPFVTTHNCRNGVEDADNAVWIVTKKTGEDYYYIRHALTGKYLVANGQIRTTTNANRMRVHMETVADEDLDDLELFSITPYSPSSPKVTYMIISPKSTVGQNGNNKWFTVNGENAASYSGATGKRDGPTGYEDTGGIIGIFSQSDKNAGFYLEEVAPVPTITVNTNNETQEATITISSTQTGVSFYYTTDGSTPSGSSTLYSGPFTLPITSSDPIIIKAVTAVSVGGTPYYSDVATASFGGSGTLCYIQSNKATQHYMLPQSNTTYAAAGTSRAEASVWKIMKADSYYYIIHYADGKYLTADPASLTNSASLETAPNDNSLFTITEENGHRLIKAKNADNADDKNYLLYNGTGTLSLGAASADEAKWNFLNVPANPTASCNADGRVSMSAPLGNIYYTIDINTNNTTPTSASTRYTAPFDIEYGPTYKAKVISIYTDRESIPSAHPSQVVDYTWQIPVAAPYVTYSYDATEDKFYVYLSSTQSGVSFRYTTDGSTEPTATSGTLYASPFEIAAGANVTIKAIAYNTVEGTNYSSTVTTQLLIPIVPTLAHSYADITSQSGSYLLADDFTASGTLGFDGPFMGTLDGQFNEITLSAPLFASLVNATIKNVVVSSASISGTDVGTICGQASGMTRIYNCGILSGTLSGTGCVGSIAGVISGNTRVVNCYSYATVSGGDYAAGIVGRNAEETGTRVALCMMYGDMTEGTNRSPVYGGYHTSNVKNFIEYNYWRSKANLSYTVYNDQQAIEKDEYLTRFPFYRHILNTHRNMASYFLFDDYDPVHLSEVGHWVLKRGTDAPPYPVVEAWNTHTRKATEEVAANLPATTDAYAGKLLTDRGSAGYLTVNVSINGSSFTSQLPITDMDTLRYDYTYGKVVLPFANEYDGWTRDYSKVCTGWKITNVSNGTAGTYANYDMANRDCTNKDLYANSDYIFAQGGYYIVPNGATAISIEAHFANAFYLSDPSYEVGYDADFSISNTAALGGTVPHSYHGQPVYTDLSTLVSKLSTTNNPHTQAIVLVGNYHYRVTSTATTLFNRNKAVTIMSTDEDCNQEPDYGWYMANTLGRLKVPALRFDFLPLIEMGMSSRVGEKMYPGIGIWHTRGWFELTETCVSNTTQCEINSSDFSVADNGKGNNRWIANSGCFIQIVRAREAGCNKLSYIQIGGNAYVKEFYPGSHTDNARESKAVPINVTGGQVEECYMTGYKSGGKLTGDMMYFWCAGGKIGKFLGAYLEEPTAAGLTARVDHALINRFFGGGTSQSARIKGNIDITINNSKVDFYCGGPEFGDMYSGKTLTTHADNTTFGVFYGAGYGGTSITYNRESQTNDLVIASNPQTTYDIPFTYYTNNRLQDKVVEGTDLGIGTCYKFEYIIHSNGTNGVTRFYTGYARFSLATTGNVTNVLNNCTVLTDFYGAGCQGKVNGTVNSTLTGCTVKGSAFGGGYKAVSNILYVYPTTKPTYSVYDRQTATFSDFGNVEPEAWEWRQGTKNSRVVDAENHIVYTEASTPMNELGNVTGDISITLNGCTIGTTHNAHADVNDGCVYGGGNESKSLKNTSVLINDTVEAKTTYINNSLFGGGNKADVMGNTTIDMRSGFVHDRVYGGGKLGSVGTFTTTTAVAGHTAHEGCIGKPNGRTGETGVCSVSISGGQVGRADMRMPEDFGYVFGASRGALADPEVDKDIDFRAYVYETNVTISGTAFIVGGVYGGSENGRVLNDTHVNIQGGQIGCGEGMSGPYSEEQFINPLTTEVTETNALAECSHWNYVYPYRPHDVFKLDEHGAEVPATDGHTFYGNVFGGGSGYFPYKEQTLTQEQIDAGLSAGMWLRSAGLVEGDTYVNITGGHILTSVYGGNELTDVIGTCHVSISGGTIGVPRTIQQIIEHPVTCYVFGAGKGDQRLNFNEWTNVGGVEVEVSGGIIYGSVFGGGEDGHVLKSVNMAIKNNSDPLKPNPVIGTFGTSYVDGNVFGAGRGFGGDALTAGTVSGNVTMNIQGGTMLGSIYGGGRLGSVGTYLVPHDHANYGQEIPDGYEQVIGADNPDVVAEGVTHGNITINISGGTIGNNYEYVPNPSAADKSKMPLTSFDYRNRLTYTKGGNVFAGGMGRLYGLDGSTLLPHRADLAKAKNTVVRISGGTIKSNVYGGAEMGTLAGNATIHVTGGTIGTTIGTGDAAYRYGSVFGGGKGSTENLPGIKQAGQINGNVLVELNHGVADDAKGGIVNQIFGCNDMNGSPKGTVTVHVYATQGEGEATLEDKVEGRYDMEAVYGGGNLAPYEPTAATGTEEEKAQAYAHVIIDGCHLTSIRQVYGGGNAASTPASLVDIYGTFEVEEAFGGGNGKDKLPSGTDNPGANVGYHDFSAYETSSEPEVGAATKALREANYSYGSGKASMNIHGGRIHRVYGGSNTKGNIRSEAVTMLEDVTGCPFNVDEAYGGGKSAPMDAESRLEMACIPGLKAAYGGAEDAEIDGNVTLNITNGHFDRVFGGNNVSGTISGKITVNIEETGCHLITIGQLYGGGNQAAYTGPLKEGSTTQREGPTLNLRSFTSIGEVYGGGYGETAVVTGDTHVNIDVCPGRQFGTPAAQEQEETRAAAYTGNRTISFVEFLRTPDGGFQYDEFGNRLTTSVNVPLYLPPFTSGTIGAINNVFGGGNAAKVIGDTYVNIGTRIGSDIIFNTPTSETEANRTHTATGVDIRGNIFGGGNNAEVTGNTNVTIGKEN